MSYKYKAVFVDGDEVQEPFTAVDVGKMIRKMSYGELEALAHLLLFHGVTRPATNRNMVDILVSFGESDLKMEELVSDET